MGIRYPNGKHYAQQAEQANSAPVKKTSFSNRGMTLEEDINETNAYYVSRNMAVIHKKPVPVQIVRVDYPARSAAVIKEAYFKQASTTDYNGIYKGKYIDFEAKETAHKTSFPLKNFHDHQITHMKQVEEHGGIAFVLIRFASTDEVFLLPFSALIQFWERMKQGGRKSITKAEITAASELVPLGYAPRIPYLDAIERIYF